MGLATAATTKGRGPAPSDRAPKLKHMRLAHDDNQADADATAVRFNQADVDDADAMAKLSSESLQLVLGFLAPRDRFALLSSHRALAHEPLATRYASFCGDCAACAAQNQHLCERPGAEARDASFWACLLRRSAASDGALRELRVAACDAFSQETLRTIDAATRATSLANLTVLDLNRCAALGADGLHILADHCTKLQELRLRDMALDASALARLVDANHATLRVVDLEGCHTLTGADARRLTVCRGLVELSLAGCHNVDNGALADVIRASPGLTALNLRFCHKVDDVLVEKIAGALPRLRALNLRYCMKVTDAAVAVICERLPLLRALDLSQCNKITDAAVGRIVDALKSLQDLRLWACGKLTSAAVQAISQAAPPSLEIVDIRSRNPVETVIGGRDGVQLLVRKRSRASLNHGGRWEPADEPGVFKRLPTCAVAA